jgi:hypothetical protein
MNYSQLIQLYFERSNALQNYWTLYVVIVGGLLAFSSLRKQPAALTTLVVSILFALFAYENLDAIHQVTMQRFATLDVIKAAPAASADSPDITGLRSKLESTLRPATYSSVQTTHITSDLLTIAALWVMELRRRKIAANEKTA